MYCTTKGMEENSSMIHVGRQKRWLAAVIHACAAQAFQKWLSSQLATKSVNHKRKTIGLTASDSGCLLEIKEGDNSRNGWNVKLTGHLFINFIIGSPNWQSLLLNWKDILGPKKQYGLIAADHWYLLRVWLWHRCPARSRSLGTGAREGWRSPALLLRGAQRPLPTCSPWNRLSSAWAEPWQAALPQHSCDAKTTLLISAEMWNCGHCSPPHICIFGTSPLKLGIARCVLSTICSFQGFLWGLRISFLWLDVYSRARRGELQLQLMMPLIIHEQSVY